MQFDSVVFNAIHGLAGKNNILDLFGIFFSTYLPYFFVIFFVILIWIEKNRKQRISNFLFVVLAEALCWGAARIALNYYFFRPRPFALLNFQPLVAGPLTASFPSAHSIFYFTLATVTYLAISRYWSIWFFA